MSTLPRCTCFREGPGKYVFCMRHPFGPQFIYPDEAPEVIEEIDVPGLKMLVERMDAQKRVIEALSTQIVDLEDQLRALVRIVDLHLKGQDLYGPRSD